MELPEQYLKKLYDKTAKTIVDLKYKKKLTEEEMNFLLTLLDMVHFRLANQELLSVLAQWVEKEIDPEIDEIIKATLVSNGLEQASLPKNLEIIKELLDTV